MSKFTLEQSAAIEAQGRTIVSASAGSGKTTVMIEKMIRLICEQGVDVKQILAVTYTKKAAASMKDKLRKALVKAINKQGGSTEEKARLKAQYRLVPLADISTVHSFCAKLIRTHFYETDVGNRFGIIAEEDADGTALKNRAIENVFERAYAENDEDFLKLLSVYFRKKKDDTLRQVILSTHSKVRTHVGYRKELELSGQDSDELFDSVCRECFLWFVKKCEIYREDLSELYRFFTDVIPREDCAKYALSLISVLESWLDAGDLFALAAMPWGKLPTKPKINPENEPPMLAAAVGKLFRIRDKIKDQMNDKERLCVDSREVERKNFSIAAEIARPLARFVVLFDDEYMRLKKQRGVLDYNDLEHIALELLEKEAVGAEMREKYRYVFVDEYQDVNPVQERIIAGVSGKNLFLVGDIKQSIYGFRGSKSKFFADKWEEFVSDPTANALKLSKNFRSASPILDAVNTQFEKIMTKKNSEVDYKNDGVMLFGELYEQGKGRVQVHFVGKEEKPKDDGERSVYSVRDNAARRQAEISKMAKKIREIIELERQTEFFDMESQSYRRVEYSDIAVLDRWKKGSISEVIAALAAEGVPVSTESPLNICDFPEIKTLLDLLRLIDNAEQDIPLASVLVSPVGGLTEDELVTVRLAFAGEGKMSFRAACRRYVAEYADSVAEKLRAFFDYFAELRQLAQVATAGEVLTKTIADKQMEAALLRGVNGESCLKRINRFLEEARSPQPMDVHEFLGRLKALDFSVPYCENGGENAVRVMTMHASKGLEFPVVILSNLGRAFRAGDSDEALYVDGYGLAPKAYDTKKMLYASTVLRLLNQRREVLEDIRDELNLYYVALTRAQYALHMLFTERSDGSDACYGKSYEDITDFDVWEKYERTGAGMDLPRLERQALALETEIDRSLVDGILRAQEWVYSHVGCENMPAKTSSTALLKLLAAETPEQRMEAFVENPFEDGQVGDGLFDSVDDGGGAADVDFSEVGKSFAAEPLTGSAYHAFLERFDFSLLNGLQGNRSALKSLVENALVSMRESDIPEEYLAALDVEKLAEILDNSVFYRFGGARLLKEQRFICSLPARDVLTVTGRTESVPDCDEDMLFQGAMDLIAVREDGAEIVDYKFSGKGKEKLAETYASQLRLYRMAAAKALKIPEETIRCTLVNIQRGYEIEIR